MRRKNVLAILAAGGLLAIGGVLGDPAFADEAAKPHLRRIVAPAKPVVQIAILLDTSNSMDGLIEQAKTQLWRIVNEFATARHNGVRPEVQVALYQYGTPSLGADNGYVRQLVPLTTDLDKVSEELFKLKTDGGDEYCGTVIKAAIDQLQWSAGNGYRAIFIAGNEPFTQGQVNYRSACKEAISRGVIVNTIFCGAEAEGRNTSWKDGADLADGSFMTIDQNERVVHVAAPQDKEIEELGKQINQTYVSYGVAGAEGKMRQEAQDANAAKASPASSVERVKTKGGGSYQNSSWDLVDAVNTRQVALKDMKAEDLPEEMRQLKPEDREAYVAKKTQERQQIQKRIAELAAERDKYIANERQKLAAGGETTAGRTQAAKNVLEFEKAPTTQPAK
jgi:hypothetical protein